MDANIRSLRAKSPTANWGFAASASRHGHAVIDRALHLPKAWTNDPARLAAAHVLEGTGFTTEPRLAVVRMVERALVSDVAFALVAADTVSA